MASSSSISYTGRSSSYDVFINFRGLDTRRNFVFLLHKALKQDGIHAFKDSVDLWEGEEICPSLLRAIRGSKISIPIFSKNYAESKYCLMELAEIWKCHLSKAQTILPVFIGVEPRDVRNQTGSFEGPFQEHQRKYASAQVEKWKIALKEVGSLKGWPLKGDADIEDQCDIVDLIIRGALKELSSTPLDECKYPIGIDSHINALHPFLDVGSGDVRFVAICGMGGLGKTTIAKAIYNKIFRKFSGSSFLANVREKASQGVKGLVCLQNQILKDILKNDHKESISVVSQGSVMIKERLHQAKVLIILDDVDDPKQLDELVGGVNWFGQGSRVLITTRDEGSLTRHKFIQIYKPRLMDFEESLQLFSFHAFSKNEPPEKYNKLSHEIVQHADGLPLTLEVLGSFLFDKDIEEWKDAIGALKDINDEKVSGMSIKIYDDKVFEKLKISYDKLSDHAKIVFLDIACNLAGWEVEKVISIWEACEMRTRLVMKELAQKHLIKKSGFRLTMHDQLRYMGREIVSKGSGGDLTRFSRLWSYDVIMQLLKEDMGTSMVEGILLHKDFEFSARGDLSWEDFAKMTRLRFLSLGYSFMCKPINGDLLSLPSKLRWLSWDDCPLEILPANFYHKEIVHLRLSSIHITQAWNDIPRNENQRFQKLKVLIMYGCSALSRSPNFFAWFPCLEILDLTACRSLQELPDSICHMNFLKSLILDCCESIKKLPACIADLKCLVKLSVKGTKLEELPDGVGQLEKLEELNTIMCSKLGKLPTSMGRMRSLLRFYLECPLALNLPDDFSKLSSLEVLEFWECNKLTELSNLSSPKRLRVLNIVGNKNIKEIHGLHIAEFLEELNVYRCVKLTVLSGLSNLKRLISLKIFRCEFLEKIHCLEELDSLENLYVISCKLTKLPNLSALKSLKVLVINCENLEEIHGIEELKSLQGLNVKGCHKLTETTRKLRGQGRLLDHFSQDERSSSIAIDHGSVPILCVVFACEPTTPKGTSNITCGIQSSICFRGKEIDCHCSINTRVKINSRDAIYLHHFNVNGLFFQTKDAIEKLTVGRVGIINSSTFFDGVQVKFWKVFSENKESFQEIPNKQSSAKLVVDFFEWSDTDGDEEEEMLQESKKSLIHYDDDETADPSLNPSSTTIMEGFDSNNGFNLQKC